MSFSLCRAASHRPFFWCAIMISRCCKDKMYVWSAEEGTAHYVCDKCDMPTDPIVLLEDDNDTRGKIEVEAITG